MGRQLWLKHSTKWFSAVYKTATGSQSTLFLPASQRFLSVYLPMLSGLRAQTLYTVFSMNATCCLCPSHHALFYNFINMWPYTYNIYDKQQQKTEQSP
jgi:hypothetical protein